MAKECIEYKFNMNEQGRLTAPSWMTDGGYYQNPADNSMVGFVPVESEREWYVPDSALVLSQSEFVARGMAMHSANPFMNDDPENPNAEMTPMTDAEVTQMLTSFYQSKVAE